MKNYVVCLSLAAASLVLPQAGFCALISVDLESSYPGEHQPFSGVESGAASASSAFNAANVWNHLGTTGFSITNYNSGNLVDSTGANTGVVFSITGRTSAYGFGNAADALLSDYFYWAGDADTDAVIQWQISGLVPSTAYQFYTYGSHSNAASPRQYSMLVDTNGNGSLLDETAVTVVSDANSSGVLVTVFSDASGVIHGQNSTDPGTEANWAGFQLALAPASPLPPSISKAFSPSTIGVNQTSALSFTIANPNATAGLSGVGFSDTLPAGVIVASPNGLTGSCGGGTITATAGSGGISLSGAALAANSSCTFSVNVVGTTAGDKVNTTTAVTSNFGSGNTASATLTVAGPPSISKAFSPSTISVNQASALSFTIANPNATAGLSGVGFSDTLPAGVIVASPNGLTGSCGGGTITAIPSSGSIGLSGATLAATSSCTFSVNVVGTTAGAKVNTTSAVTSNFGNGNTASATLTVAGPPSISKTFSPSAIGVNQTSALSFTITNPNATAGLSGAGFGDTLPAGVVVASPNGLTGSCGGGTITATAGSGSIGLSGATLAANSSCSFSVNVVGTTVGDKLNTTTAVTSNFGSGNTASATLTVAGPPSISKAFSPSTIGVSQTSALSFTITNPNATGGLSGVGFGDTLPAGVVVASPNGLTGSCGGGTITATAGSGSIGLSGATLAANSSCTFSVNVVGTTAGDKVNTTTAVTSNFGNGNTASATLTVAGPPSISKAFSPSTIGVNQTSALSFTITNTNATAGLSGVGFGDTLPAGVIVASPNGLTGSCGGGTITATAGSGSISLSGATLAANSSCTFSVNVAGTTAGDKANTTSAVTSNFGNGNTASATLTVAGPPSISKAFSPSTIGANQTSVLSFTITNPNVTAGLSGVGFSDTLPSGVIVASPNGLTGSCGGGTITATAGSGSISLSGATLAANSSCTFSVNVAGTTAGDKVNTTSAVTSNFGSGNTASATLTVAGPPSISKAFSPSTIGVNQTSALSFTITNPNATAGLSGVGFGDTLPAGVIVASPNGLTGSCGGGTITATAGSGSIGLSGATLAANSSCTFSVNVVGTTVGAKANTTSAVTSNFGSGNTASATLTVAGPPSISKAFSPSTIGVNQTSALSFTITNPNATAGLSGVGFGDTLPAGVIVASPNGLTGSCGGGTITATAGSGIINLSGATIAANSSCTFSVNVLGTAAGIKNNTTSPVTSTFGPGNAASATLTVAAPPSITKAFQPNKILPGGISALSFTVTNPNSFTSVPGVGFTDTFPSGLVISMPNGLTGSCGGGAIIATAGSGIVSLAGATLAANDSCTFSVNVTAPEGTYINTTGPVFSTYGNGNPATDTLSSAATPTLSKSFGTLSMGVNDTATLKFVLTNPNQTLTLHGLQFSDTLPAGLLVATPSTVTGTCGGGTITAVAGGNLITLGSATLAPQTSCTLSVRITSNGTALGPITNTTSTVTSNEALAGTAATATIFVGDPFQVSYAANLSAGDSYVDITNTGARGAALQSGTTANITGAVCANVYAFTPDEQLVSCCSCPVTPNGLVSLSAENDLAGNTLTPAVPTAVVIKLVASVPVAGSCNNSAASVTASSLANGMKSFATTLHATPVAGSYGVTETPFSPATLSAGELGRITNLCNFILANGSGFGVCRTCRLGALGGERQ